MEDKINWKRGRALTLHTFREAKQKSCMREYVSTLNAYTPSSKVWELNIKDRSRRKINILKINEVRFSSVEQIGKNWLNTLNTYPVAETTLMNLLPLRI